MRKITDGTVKAILKKTPWGHSVRPFEEGLNEEEIKGLFYRAITDSENSVIAEINRIVEEANDELANVDVAEKIGKIEDCPLIDQNQKWLRINRLLFVYQSNVYDRADLTALSDVVNIEAGESVLFKVTAPEGVIPDQSLTLKIGGKEYVGLELLRNDNSEALEGIYYLYFAVSNLANDYTEASVKWNSSLEEEKIVVSFNGAIKSGKSLYIKYARTKHGDDFSSSWSEGLKYIGFYIGNSDVEDKTKYVWARFLPDYISWSQSTLTVTDWQYSDHYDLTELSVTADDVLIVSPTPSSIDDWTKFGLYCAFDQDGNPRLYYKVKPTCSIGVNFLIGVAK